MFDRTSIIVYLALLAMGWSLAPTAEAGKFPPAIEKRRYGDDVEQIISRVREESPRLDESFAADFQQACKLQVIRQKRITRADTVSRSGRVFAQGDRLDVRWFIAGEQPDVQVLRDANAYMQYLVYEDELRRLWPDSVEKDSRADELSFGYLWLPFLVNLYPDEYLRWADRYEYEGQVESQGTLYDVLHAYPDYDLARRNRDIQSSADYWGLRPQIRYFVNPRTRRIEIVERLAYEWDRLKPDEASFLSRRRISRVTEWQNVGRYILPAKIHAEELNPRFKEGIPYKEFDLTVNNARLGDSLPRDAFKGLWPEGSRFLDGELRELKYYRGKIDENDSDLSNWFMTARCAYAVGDATYATQALEKIKERLGDAPSADDLASLCRVYLATVDKDLIAEGGKMLETALAASDRGESTNRRVRDKDLVRLHIAVSEHLSRQANVSKSGRSVDDKQTAANYLEAIFDDIKDPAARRRLLGRIVTDYAQEGLWEKAESLLDEQAASCADGPESEQFLSGARLRIDYWRTTMRWWYDIIDRMKDLERKRAAKRAQQR